MTNFGKSHKYALTGKHLLRYIGDPVAFVYEQIFKDDPKLSLDPDQKKLMEAVAAKKSVSWRSAQGIGKTMAIACLVIWFLYCFPRARVVCTSVKREQLADVLWPEIQKWLLNSHLAQDFVWKAESIGIKGKEKQAFAIARTGNSPEALSGLHEDFMLVLADEASGIETATFEPLDGTLTGMFNVFVMTGNPTRTSGFFYDSHHKNRGDYVTLHTSALGHPRIPKAHIDKMARQWGVDSDVYRVRVLGEFPRGDPTSFIPLELAVAAQQRTAVSGGTIHVGVDVARFGDDRSVAIGHAGSYVFPRFMIHGKKDTRETTGLVMRYINDLRASVPGYGQQLAVVKVDDTGVGGGVTDGLCELAKYQNLEVVPCNFGGEGNDEYDNWAALAYAQVKEFLRHAQLPARQPEHEDLVAELTTRRFKVTGKGKVRLEPKSDYKLRHHFSPDLADAFCLAVCEESAVSISAIPASAAHRSLDAEPRGGYDDAA